MPLGMEIGLGPSDFVFDGDAAPPQKKRHSPIQFLAHVYCGQTAEWIKMPPDMEVSKPLARRRCVTWGLSSPLKGGQPPVFGHVCCGKTARWMKTPLGTEVYLGPGHIVLDGDPAPPPR